MAPGLEHKLVELALRRVHEDVGGSVEHLVQEGRPGTGRPYYRRRDNGCECGDDLACKRTSTESFQDLGPIAWVEALDPQGRLQTCEQTGAKAS